jgi:CxxC motif-containing protein (DUF1111 family)
MLRRFDIADGIGPTFYVVSCVNCHEKPVIGRGAGLRDVDVMRYGSIDETGKVLAPEIGTILPTNINPGFLVTRAGEGVNLYEHRQTPALFGLGLVDAIPDDVIVQGADATDEDEDGISGRPHVLPDGRLGKFGWKAQVPSPAEFVRDAGGAELGLAIEKQADLTFGMSTDDDDVADPELPATEADQNEFFMSQLAPPPRQMADTEEGFTAILLGEKTFSRIGCANCHTP